MTCAAHQYGFGSGGSQHKHTHTYTYSHMQNEFYPLHIESTRTWRASSAQCEYGICRHRLLVAHQRKHIRAHILHAMHAVLHVIRRHRLRKQRNPLRLRAPALPPRSAAAAAGGGGDGGSPSARSYLLSRAKETHQEGKTLRYKRSGLASSASTLVSVVL